MGRACRWRRHTRAQDLRTDGPGSGGCRPRPPIVEQTAVRDRPEAAVERSERGHVALLEVFLPPVVTGQVPEGGRVVGRDLDASAPPFEVTAVPPGVGDDRPEPGDVSVRLA